MELDYPHLDEILEKTLVVGVRLRTPFRGVTLREVMLIQGTQGPGEWAAFLEYSDEVAARWLLSALEQAFGHGVATPASSLTHIPVNATFPALDLEQIPFWWSHFSGCQSAKIKVGEPGQSLTEDVERVRVLRDAVGPEVKIRLDVNARWGLDQAEAAILAFHELDIDYVEQPVASVGKMVKLKRRLAGTGIRLAADELIRQNHALTAVIDRGAADIAVLKTSPLGGVRRTLSLADEAHGAGLEVVISSALETSVGLSWGIRTAALLTERWGAIPDSGLGTAVFLTHDVVRKPLLVDSGRVAVSDPVLDFEAINAVKASAERTAWWQDRLRRCYPLALEMLENQR